MVFEIETNRCGRLFYRQCVVNLADGIVHMFERLAGQAGTRLLEEALRGAKLGVGSALWFMILALAADFRAGLTEGQFDLLHRFDAMPFVIVFGLGKCSVSVVQQCRCTGGLGVRRRDKAESQKDGGQQGRTTKKQVVSHGKKVPPGNGLSNGGWRPP